MRKYKGNKAVMRVLLTSIGRRGYLVKYFKEALGNKGEVWGADNSPYATAFHYCDRNILLPEVTDDNYVDELILSKRENKHYCAAD